MQHDASAPSKPGDLPERSADDFLRRTESGLRAGRFPPAPRQHASSRCLSSAPARRQLAMSPFTFTGGVARRSAPIAVVLCFTFVVSMLVPVRLNAADGGTVTGAVVDQLGGAISGA